MTSAILNHEVLALPVLPKKRGIPSLHTFAPLTGALPCDFYMLNLRSVQHQQDSHSPSPYMALILHRKGLDCDLETPALDSTVPLPRDSWVCLLCSVTWTSSCCSLCLYMFCLLEINVFWCEKCKSIPEQQQRTL
ncbi:unnamed protein product [Oncorhynchus mykiss]|uniref:Uncharacterized protein n=1 Tax=Oncorhynchus mykiss TaxID=8022 RepID=A0A060WSZ6_ONCMY|nr:unnamed protein product [Oncorhynchus mykiss]